MASLLQSRLLHISVAVLSGVAAAFFLVSIPRPFTTGPLRSLPLSSQKHDRKAMGGSEEPSCVCDADAPVDRRASAGEFAGFKAILEDSSRNASECCCSILDLEQTNSDSVYPLLKRVVASPFFGHYKVNLCSECELWQDTPLCMLRDCGVCECESPPAWAAAAAESGGGEGCSKGIDDKIVTAVTSQVRDGWRQGSGATAAPFSTGTSGSAFTSGLTPPPPPPPLPAEDGAVVVDLRLNPERYTAYAGPSASKVWAAIHDENCFQPTAAELAAARAAAAVAAAAAKASSGTDGSASSPDAAGGNTAADPAAIVEESTFVGVCQHFLPAEQRIYNRILSGLHSSISLHIAKDYCLELDQETIGECKVWGANTTLAQERVLDFPDRLENLYVAFAVLLRAVVKAGNAITAAVPSNDPEFADGLHEWTTILLPEIEKLAGLCPKTFDEEQLFVGLGAKTMWRELKSRIDHLQSIIQCVGCDRCKLWGTLQVNGIGTALKILFPEPALEGATPTASRAIVLSRQDSVALVHTLERLSASIAFAHEVREGTGKS